MTSTRQQLGASSDPAVSGLASKRLVWRALFRDIAVLHRARLKHSKLMGTVTFVLLIALTPLRLTAALAAKDPVLEPLPVTEVASGVFVSVGSYELATPTNADNISNTGFIIGTTGVAVIDTGGSRIVGARLLAAIRARTDRPIRYVINTHDHPDHILGNVAFVATGAEIVGHHRLPEALAARGAVYLDATQRLIGPDMFAGTRVIPPTILVHDKMALDLGGRQLLLEAWPVAHTDTDLTVLDSDTGTWFLGDLLFAGHLPALDGSLKGWLAVIQTLRQRPVQRAVPGHGPAVLPWPTALDAMDHYLVLLRDETSLMIKQGRTMREASAEVARSERSRWALFDEFNARNVTTAYHELEWDAP